MAVERLGADAARRIAVRAQGFGRPKPVGTAGIAAVKRTVERLGLLQLDSVNVFCRSHYMPVFSRLGPYQHELMDRLAAHGAGKPGRRQPRALFEYWGHEASLLPVSTHPLMRWRMAKVDTEAWRSIAAAARNDPGLVREVLAVVTDRGPIRASELGFERPQRKPQSMWNWHAGKVVLEYLFYAGQVTAAGRTNFERLYDLPERVLPAAVLAAPTPAEADAQRELVRIAASRLGVGTEQDFGDYFRLPRAASKARLAELVESGELLPVAVAGWARPGYLWSGTPTPRRVEARALLSPFDSLVWFRERTERLFGFHYRIEIYTPAPKRIFGYYVLPFLLGDSLVARVDLKADRQQRLLLVRGAFAEAGADHGVVARELAEELQITARWLGLEGVVVEPNGDLAGALATAAR
jgi:uncharacterized protein YcaQ